MQGADVYALGVCCARLDEIIVFRQLTKGEVKEIADIMLREVFKRAEVKGITIDVTERFKVRRALAALHPATHARVLRLLEALAWAEPTSGTGRMSPCLQQAAAQTTASQYFTPNA